jgi:hypothetical protein
MRKGIYISTLLTLLVASLLAAPAEAQQERRSPTPEKPVHVKETQRLPTRAPSASPASTQAYEVLPTTCNPSLGGWSTLAQTQSGGHYYSFKARTCLLWDAGVRRMKVRTRVQSLRDGNLWNAYSINGDTVVMAGLTSPCQTCSWVENVRRGPGYWADQGGTGRVFESPPFCAWGAQYYWGWTDNLRIAWTSSLVSDYHWHGSLVQGFNTAC